MITEAQFNLLRRMADQGMQADMDVGLGANVLTALLNEIAAARAVAWAAKEADFTTVALGLALRNYDAVTKENRTP